MQKVHTEYSALCLLNYIRKLRSEAFDYSNIFKKQQNQYQEYITNLSEKIRQYEEYTTQSTTKISKLEELLSSKKSYHKENTKQLKSSQRRTILLKEKDEISITSSITDQSYSIIDPKDSSHSEPDECFYLVTKKC